MIVKLVTPPASEPVTLTEAKAHLRVDASDDDALITALITAAREYFEETTRRALISQTWRLSLDDWPGDGVIELPKTPLQSVSSIAYTDSDGSTTAWDSANYNVDTDSEPGRVMLGYDKSFPSATLDVTNPIQITFVAGYGDDAEDVPQRMKQAILLLIGHWYENRETAIVTGAIPKEIPLALDSLIYLNRVY